MIPKKPSRTVASTPVVAIVAALIATVAGASRPAPAAVTIRARILDGAASARALAGAVRDRQGLDASLKVPLADAPVQVVLLAMEPVGAIAPEKTWTVTTDAEGRISVETGLDRIPEGQAFVASGLIDGRKVHSAFFLPQGGTGGNGEDPIHLYPTTESPLDIRAQLKVAYDIEMGSTERDSTEMGSTAAGAGPPLLRVRAGLQLNNVGKELYVGARGGSPWREVWRIPVPAGAKITLNRGPLAGGPRWRRSEDLRWLLIDAPVPGLCDLDLQGTWEVEYTVPARQTLVQSFPVAGHLDSLQLSVWAVDGSMELKSAQLLGPVVDQFPDPFTGEPRRFRILYVNEPSHVGTSYVAALTVDNAAIGQISRTAALWVGSFVLTVLGAVAVGLGLGRRRVGPVDATGPLEEEDVLDRISALDARAERGEIPERDYSLYREALVQIAARELDEPRGAESVSNNPPAAHPAAGGARRPSGAEEGEAACRGRCGGGAASPARKETQSLSDSCSGSESGAPGGGEPGGSTMGAAALPDAALPDAPHPWAALPQAAREILRRLDEIDSRGPSGIETVAERAHLLEALAKAIPREEEAR